MTRTITASPPPPYRSPNASPYRTRTITASNPREGGRVADLRLNLLLEAAEDEGAQHGVQALDELVVDLRHTHIR